MNFDHRNFSLFLAEEYFLNNKIALRISILLGRTDQHDVFSFKNIFQFNSVEFDSLIAGRNLIFYLFFNVKEGIMVCVFCGVSECLCGCGIAIVP